ncbi:PD-(D/E)XK nuclease family protein [Myxacorys almedinensis]|uniref:PD-(D/E)XK nuclease family protein n=1 Tax=Myxacorys almedinensis TaxID=2651157 RepID=UPI00192E81CA|nr:PD-(D/E)XK nuclease family protein [Myxacorys almedinensis]
MTSPSTEGFLPRYQAKPIKEAGKQYYVSAEGMRVPSVTTILNATKPPEDWDRLMNWKQQVGASQAAQITQTASRRGTGTHRQIQRYLEGKEVACSETVLPYWESVLPVLSAVEQVRLVEGLVVHDKLRYGGVVDCVASYEGVPCVCEWKTADKPKRSLERLYDYPLQMVAYWGAVNRLYDLDLQNALLVVALPHQPAEVFWFEQAAIAQYWQQWEARVEQYWRRMGYFR